MQYRILFLCFLILIGLYAQGNALNKGVVSVIDSLSQTESIKISNAHALEKYNAEINKFKARKNKLNPKDEAFYKLHKGIFYFYSNNLDSSINYLTDAKQLCKTNNINPQLIFEISHKLFVFFTESRLFDLAKKELFFLENLVSTSPDLTPKLGSIYNYQGISNLIDDQFYASIDKFENSRKIALHHKDFKTFYFSTLNLSIALLHSNQSDKSIAYLNECLEYFEKNGFRLEVVKAYNCLCLNYLSRNKLKELETHAEKMQETSLDLPNRPMLAHALYYTAYAQAENNTKRALINCEKAYKIAHQQALCLSLLVDICSLTHKIYYSQCNYEQAYQYALLTNKLTDSILTNKNKASVAEIETLKKAHDISERLKLKEMEIKALKEDERRTQLVALLIIVLVLLIMFIVVYYLKTHNKVLAQDKLLKIQENEVMQKEKELISSELSSMIGKVVTSKHALRKRIYAEPLSNNDRVALQQMSFDEYIAKIYEEAINRFPDFVPKLRSLNANLTERDRMILLSVKLGLSNYEISEIFKYGNIKSVSVVKSRLKQKLNLPKDASLQEWVSVL